MKLRVLDLFSGIGGFSLGLERTGGFETVAFCEIDPYCRSVLRKHWPDVPAFFDIRDATASVIIAAARGRSIDLICGGFPCQPFSVAGKRRGAADDRHLWPEMFRLVQECRPAWVIGENVAGLIRMGLDRVLSDLEGAGYACRTFVIPACAVDAPHRRERVWIVAHLQRVRELQSERGVADKRGWSGDSGQSAMAHDEGRRGQDGPAPQERQGRSTSGGDAIPDTECGRFQGRDATWEGAKTALSHHRWEPEPDVGQLVDGLPAGLAGSGFRWPAEPQIGRVASGVPNRVHKLRSLGNAVVPQVVEAIGRAILAAEQPPR